MARIEKEDAELWYKITGGSSAGSGTVSIRQMLTVKGKSIRARAKDITRKQKSFYEAGRLGMIIDGTGHVYSKIQKNKKHAESLGYDTYMVFVNTSLEVALERNRNRERVLSDELVTQSWKDVQNNLGKFQNLFGGNFRIVDNTVYKPVSKEVVKAAQKFMRKPVYNKIGQKWINNAKALKKAGYIKK